MGLPSQLPALHPRTQPTVLASNRTQERCHVNVDESRAATDFDVSQVVTLVFPHLRPFSHVARDCSSYICVCSFQTLAASSPSLGRSTPISESWHFKSSTGRHIREIAVVCACPS